MICENVPGMTEEQMQKAKAELFRIWQEHSDSLTGESQWPCLLIEQETGKSRHSNEAAAFSAFIAGIEVGLNISKLKVFKEREGRDACKKV